MCFVSPRIDYPLQKITCKNCKITGAKSIAVASPFAIHTQLLVRRVILALLRYI